MKSEFNEEAKTQMNEENVEENSESSFVYKAVMKGEGNKRTFSVVSLILSVVSVFLFVFPWAAAILGVLGVVFSVVSRKNLGYFDGFSLAGLILGIFGIVFGISGLWFGAMIMSIFF